MDKTYKGNGRKAIVRRIGKQFVVAKFRGLDDFQAYQVNSYPRRYMADVVAKLHVESAS
jgi:hypothetical protein